MSTVVRVDDLTAFDFTVPDASPPVHLTRLSVDYQSGASWVLVRFPLGWSRAALGYYEAAEELYVLDGSLEMNGVSIQRGDHAWVPAGCLRADSGASGLSTVAWFGGPARWVRGAPPPGVVLPPEMTVTRSGDRPVEPTPFGPGGRCLRRTKWTSSWLVEDRCTVRLDGLARIEMFSPADGLFVVVEPGEVAPDLVGPVFVRATEADQP